MTDVFSSAERSAVMTRIRSKDTKPEVFVRRLLFASGFRYRLHSDRLQGHPDVVLPKWRVVVFVNGCFWHSHEGCPRAARPSDNADFWAAKLRRNKERDAENRRILTGEGWRVLVVWECACRKRTSQTLRELMAMFIREETAPYGEIGRTEVAEDRIGGCPVLGDPPLD